ncbi:Hypothetical protein R9X50_00679500 [Acrodontium crateriforme]|uniref:Uncharacterized protein n=1 Tax=Acrodontium crateriforme TaxID=150365 RepID=A0AAQ3M8H7_9PEZI|nr:Hypothetical protein R9X50_00679500 [Acrodontium crateriforme]
MFNGFEFGTKPKEEPIIGVHTGLMEEDETGAPDRPKGWKPLTLRVPFLLSIIGISCALVLIVEWLVVYSKHQHGILLAQNINDLPLRSTFGYLYLPTIISVLYSLMWAWIDLDIKRIEPYLQLSRPDGARAEDSLLLHYPFDFLATLPLKTFKRRHWSVLTVSLGVMVVFWGLTPIQSGMFAIRTITIQEEKTLYHATDYTPTNRQGNLSSIFAQSVYNIAWLNESLPSFMTTDFALSAFGTDEKPKDDFRGEYTGLTMLYSVDVNCEPAQTWNNSGGTWYNSSSGCSFDAPPYRPNGGDDSGKPYDTIYVGFQNENGFADWYLSDSCPSDASHTFFIRWSKSTRSAILSNDESTGGPEDGQANATSLFCQPFYYQQQVMATIQAPLNAVVNVTTVGRKTPLVSDIFNISTFEWAMSSGQEEFPSRNIFPKIGFPDQKTQLQNMPLNLNYLPKMAPFAIASYKRAPEEYMTSETLRLSYQAAYRLLFARQMVDILSSRLDYETQHAGQQSYVTQAVVIVPGFAHATAGLLCMAALLVSILLILITQRSNLLESDPCTIGALMDLTIDEQSTTTTSLLKLEGKDPQSLRHALRGARFRLLGSSRSLDQSSTTCIHLLEKAEDTETIDEETPVTYRNKSGIRPTGLRWFVGASFTVIQAAAIIAFATLYVQTSRSNGLPLPSSSTMVRQIVENYIPVAISTIMDPAWLVVTRQLCLLQPWNVLMKGSAKGSKSIDVNYNSLPPQLLVPTAIRSGHFKLALMCGISLLANVLTVALSSLFYEDTVSVRSPLVLSTPYLPRFKELNGTGLPFNADVPGNWQGGTTFDQFYREMSYLTANTSLPPWTDTRYAYVPMNLPQDDFSNTTYRVETAVFSANLACQAMNGSGSQNFTLTFSHDAASAQFSSWLLNNDGIATKCIDRKSGGISPVNQMYDLRDPQSDRSAIEFSFGLQGASIQDDDEFCRQHVVAIWARSEWQMPGSVTDGTSARPNMTLSSLNTTMILCRPTIVAGEAEVTVDNTGRIQALHSAKTSTENIDAFFSTNSSSLIAQAHQFLVDNGATWHKDAFPSDFTNYLMIAKFNSSELVNASLAVPKFEVAAPQFSRLYTELFALLVGSNPELLFERGTNVRESTAARYRSETRIFMSLPAFILSEMILALYFITTALVYTRTPARRLPRLPNTIASMISYFAASQVLETMRTETLTGCYSGRQLRKQWRWKFGEYVGSDGLQCWRIEKE